jgi:hypothetical protein
MEEYIGKEFVITTKGTLKDKTWEVLQKVTQKRSKDLENWEEEEFSVLTFDKTFETAYATNVVALGSYLKDCGGDLFLAKKGS